MRIINRAGQNNNTVAAAQSLPSIRPEHLSDEDSYEDIDTDSNTDETDPETTDSEPDTDSDFETRESETTTRIGTSAEPNIAPTQKMEHTESSENPVAPIPSPIINETIVETPPTVRVEAPPEEQTLLSTQAQARELIPEADTKIEAEANASAIRIEYQRALEAQTLQHTQALRALQTQLTAAQQQTRVARQQTRVARQQVQSQAAALETLSERESELSELRIELQRVLGTQAAEAQEHAQALRALQTQLTAAQQQTLQAQQQIQSQSASLKAFSDAAQMRQRR